MWPDIDKVFVDIGRHGFTIKYTKSGWVIIRAQNDDDPRPQPFEGMKFSTATDAFDSIFSLVASAEPV